MLTFKRLVELVVTSVAAFVAITLIVMVTVNHQSIATSGNGKITDADIFAMFNKLAAKTGQTQDRPYFMIVEDTAVNAYTDGHKVVLLRGMIDYAKNKDELALVLGHELAHVMLGHLSAEWSDNSPAGIAVREGNADKMGAYYMMRAGYNVCKGRELWKRLGEENGEYQDRDHPTPVYRYSELNVDCE